MSLTSGTRVGVFEIVAKLGEGGMGEVYRARDTRLDRDVALKVLPDLFTGDPERLARFEREAKLLASLNHPHIAQVYGFEPPSGPERQAAIAMELVEGQTIQALLAAHAAEGGPVGLPLERALAIARQIAAALEAAHEQGIVHRDLKPANVSIREDGTVKVLDFGLAKAFAADAESAQSAVLAQSPTLTARATQLGMILGTAAYMSPEQARGRAVDRRADVWAFGAVLFEMLAGRRAFEGDDVSDVLASVLKSDPDWSGLPADVPAPVRRLLRRCLEKDPKKRLRDIGEGMLQLDEGLATGSSSSSSMPAATIASGHALPARSWWRRGAPLLATAVVTAAVVAPLAMLRRPAQAPPAVVRMLHTPPDATPLLSSQTQRDLAISPDGRTLAYATAAEGRRGVLYLRRLDRLEGTPLRGADAAVAPFFSPDSQWVGFVNQGAQEQIRKVPVLGGPSVLVTTANSIVLGATWMNDGIVFGTRVGPLQVVADGGGAATAVTALDGAAGEVAHVWPAAVRDTTVVLFTVISDDNTGGNTGSANTTLAAVDRASGRVVRLGLAGAHPRFVPTGHLVYATVDGALHAVAFDPGRLAISGTPVPVLEGVGIKVSGAANFDVSANGHLVHAGASAIMPPRTLVWVDRAGRETAIAAPTRNYFYARVSPDGSRISLDVRDEQRDLWIWDVRRETLSRLTDRAVPDEYALWTPDQRLIFHSRTAAGFALFRHRPDGVGAPEQVTEGPTAEKIVPFPNAVTPDGKQVIFRAASGGEKSDLFVADIEGARSVRPLLSTEHDERNAALSPDGRFMAFESDITDGRLEVFVRPFPNVDAAQFKVSIDGGEEPLWSPDGKAIFYLANGKLMAVPAAIRSERLELGKPAALFDVSPYFFGGLGRNYDIAPDGQRFVMIKNLDDRRNGLSPIAIVLNWTEELRTRLPASR
jgi:serine/threonine-protein kinase